MASTSLGFKQTTSGLNTAKSLTDLGPGSTPAIPDGTTFAIIQAEVQAVRWRDDGTAPTASVGMSLAVGDTLTVESSRFTNFKVIEKTASATVNITYYK